MMDIAAALLDFVQSSEYRPMKPRLIARHLGLDEEQQRELKRIIKRLVKQGKLAFGPSHMVQPVALVAGKVRSDRITGVFRRVRAGHGFVRPSGSPPGSDNSNDIHVAAKDTLDAASGDVVLVRLRKPRTDAGGKTQLSGAILEVIERETHQFVGTYFETAGAAMVQIDGKVFASPIPVGDPGAKNAQPQDKVVIELVRFPSPLHEGEGVITEVLGQRGESGVDTLSIIREFNLPDQFAEDALDDARRQADAFHETIGSDREDFTKQTIITIDPVDARDFDDAISLEINERGHWLLGVHIADVSHFVQPKTPLDREAHARATSVYLPDRVIPMLPEIISNGLASLQPNRVRYTKTAFLEFTPDGIRCDTRPARGAIQSARRFTYEEVDDYLAHPKEWESKLTPEVHSLLNRMHMLAMILRKRRGDRGALELNLREVKVDLDKTGKVCGAHRVENTVSHQIIEEFMLSANEAVAELIHAQGWPFLRRVHQAPDPRKLKALTQFVTELGIPAENLENRFELQKLLRDIADTPQVHAVHYAALRSLQRAVYSPEEDGHYALASECYCHFTSPIRRYPDLTIHRLLDAIIAGKKPRNDVAELAVLGEHCSDRERRAESAERELTRVKLLEYLATRQGEELDAVITGVEEFGLFVQGVELPAEGLVHISSLRDDFYRYDKRFHTLIGNRAGNRFRLGDSVRVVIARVDVDRRELDFWMVAGSKKSRRVMGEVDGGTEKPGKKHRSHHAEPPTAHKRKQRPGKTERKKRRGGE
jgi:ribonuclease R